MKPTAMKLRYANQFNGTILLMATILAGELAMLNIIFWAGVQGTIPGLAVATLWPWVVAVTAPAMWSVIRHRLTTYGGFVSHVRPELAAVAGLALVAVVFVSRLAIAG